MTVASSVDWTQVLLALIAAVPATVAAWAALGNRRQMKLPSGGSIGAAVEQARALASVSTMHTTEMLRQVNGGTLQVAPPDPETAEPPAGPTAPPA